MQNDESSFQTYPHQGCSIVELLARHDMISHQLSKPPDFGILVVLVIFMILFPVGGFNPLEKY
jgi:hypothetical protein